jgi:hypothetical protein
MIQYYARIKQTSEYSDQDPGTYFPVQLTDDPNNAYSTYIWEGGPGKRYRSQDINLFVFWNSRNQFIKVL